MGIQDLNEFLKQKAPHAYKSVKASIFNGKRIAVDANLFLFASFSAAYNGAINNELTNDDLLKEVMSQEIKDSVRLQVMNRVSMFLNQLLSNDITPIFVFDGEAVPEKISGARDRRKAVRQQKADKLKMLRDQILTTPAIERNPRDYDTLRAMLRQSPPVMPTVDFPVIRNYINENISGVITISAPDEAEKFCSFLAIRGIAAASYSTDTDCYAIGAPLIIRGLKYVEGVVWFDVVVVPIILAMLDMTQEQFLDMCITFGCDFNTRIKGYGPAKMWKLLSEAKTQNCEANRLIELASTFEPNLSWCDLNAERCRQIFSDMTECEKCLKTIMHNFDDVEKNVKFY